MARFAQITHGIVTGINKTAVTPALGWVSAPGDVQLGWLYDGSTFSPPPEPEPEPRALSLLEFKMLVMQSGQFTAAQYMDARNDTAPEVQLVWEFLGSASKVERDHPATVQGLAALQAAGHLTEAQITAINADWPVE